MNISALLTLEGCGRSPKLGRLFLYLVYSRRSVTSRVVPKLFHCVSLTVDIVTFPVNCDQEFIFHLPRWKTRASTAIFEALRVRIWETESVYLPLPPLLHRFSLPFSSVSLFLIGWRSRWAPTVHFLQLRGSFLFSFCLSWVIAGLHQLVLWGPPLGMDGSGKICQSRGSSEQKVPLWGVGPIRQI